MQDPALVRAILAGEEQRFSEVVDRHGARVRREVGRLVPDPGAREELVQDAFVQAFRRLRDLARPARLGPWLGRIARHQALEHLRRRRRLAERPLEEANEAASPAAPGAWLWNEVARLSPEHARVLEMRYREGASYREVARALGVPTSTVRGRIYEARRALRRRLEERHGDER